MCIQKWEIQSLQRDIELLQRDKRIMKELLGEILLHTRNNMMSSKFEELELKLKKISNV